MGIGSSSSKASPTVDDVPDVSDPLNSTGPNKVYNAQTKQTIFIRPDIESYAQLNFLDIVLIRSKHVVAGLDIDARVISHIRHATLGVVLPEKNEFNQFDRIGLILLPSSFLDVDEYSPDNIEVIEAGPNGVQLSSLRQVMESALEIVIRPLRLPLNRKLKEKSKSADEDEEDDVDDDDEDLDGRMQLMQKFYQFTGTVINRPYGSCMDKLQPMFRHVTKQLKQAELTQEDIRKMNDFIAKYEEEIELTSHLAMARFNGQKTIRCIPFDRLIQVFQGMTSLEATEIFNGLLEHTLVQKEGENSVHASKVCKIRNTFTDQEIFELVSQFGPINGEEKVTLSSSGHLPTAEFLSVWRSSLERSRVLHANIRELISGAFVSQVFQHIGLLPLETQQPAATSTSSSSSSSSFYLPSDFAQLKREDDALQLQNTGSGAKRASSYGRPDFSHTHIHKHKYDVALEVDIEDREGVAALALAHGNKCKLGPEYLLPPPPPPKAKDA